MAEAALRARTTGLPLSAAAAAATAAATSATAAAAASSAGGMGSAGPGGAAGAACPSPAIPAVPTSDCMASAAPLAAANGDTSGSSSPSAAAPAVPAAPSSPLLTAGWLSSSTSSSPAPAAADCPVAPLARLLRPSAAAALLLAVENQIEGASGSTCTAARSSDSSCTDDGNGTGRDVSHLWAQQRTAVKFKAQFPESQGRHKHPTRADTSVCLLDQPIQPPTLPLPCVCAGPPPPPAAGRPPAPGSPPRWPPPAGQPPPACHWECHFKLLS